MFFPVREYTRKLTSPSSQVIVLTVALHLHRAAKCTNTIDVFDFVYIFSLSLIYSFEITTLILPVILFISFRKMTRKVESNKKIENKSKVVRKNFCEKCKKSFQRKQFLILHNTTAHTDRIEKILCPLWPTCSAIKRTDGHYSNKANLQNHLNKHHDSYPMPDKLKIVVFERNECE